MAKAPRIFIDASRSFMNAGSYATLVCSLMALREFIPEAEFSVVSFYPEFDHKRYEKYGFNLRLLKGSSSRLGTYALSLKEYARADVIIGAYGDGPTDNAVTRSLVSSSAKYSLGMLIARLMGKKFVLYPSSIGPFNTGYSRFLARLALNRVSAVLAREEITRHYLEDMGVKKVRLAADVAFILEPAPAKRVKEIFLREGISRNKKNLIGLNISQLINFKSKNSRVKQDYIELMAKTADYLVSDLGATVLLIPHEIYPAEVKQTIASTKWIGGDDIAAVKECFSRVKDKSSVIPIVNEYTPEELKGIIGRCEMFIGARMHSNIAAISQGIPTIAIAYSHKAPGIMSLVGLGKYVCRFDTMDFSELSAKITDVWSSREEIRKQLTARAEELKQSVWQTGKLVSDLLGK